MKDNPLFCYLEAAFYAVTVFFLAYNLPFHIILFVLLPLCIKVYGKLTIGWCRSLQRIDGKTVIITGGNVGIGLETAKDLARRGGKIILACRSLERGKAAVDEIVKETGSNKVFLKQLDLASFASIRKFCKEIIAEESRLDILVNNAGAATRDKVITADKLELNFQANHYGPFLLTHLLLDLMRKTEKSRIVMVSSNMHKFVRTFDLDNLNSEKAWEPMWVYGRTKLANVLMTKELHRRLKEGGHDITVNALHPGAVRTAFLSFMDEVWYYRILAMIQKFFFKNATEGAQTSIHLAVSEELATVSGEYFEDCEISGINKLAKDPVLVKQLWDNSVKSVGLKSEDTIVW